MAYRIAPSMRRPDSKFEQHRTRIPTDVVDIARGRRLAIPLGEETVIKQISPTATHVQLSLRTADMREAKIRNGQVATYLEAFWQSLRDEPDPKTLTHRQTVALAGEFYKTFTTTLGDNPGSVEMWDSVFARNAMADLGVEPRKTLFDSPESVGRDAAMEQRFGPMVDTFLGRRALFVDADSRKRLIEQFFKAGQEMASQMVRMAEGDYSPDQTIQRFPEWTDQKKQKGPNQSGGVTITGLLDGWWAEVKADKSIKTYEAYEKAVRYLREFLKHDDAGHVKPEDIVAFKDHRMQQINPRTGKTLSAKTVGAGEIVGLKTIFGWGVSNLKIQSNPAEVVKVKVGKTKRVRDRHFSESEQAAILSLSADYRGTRREQRKTTLAKQWVPWICAYTGARVGEIAQLRKQDVYNDQGIWVIRITPEAGDVKTKEFRLVPVHDHLIERGLLTIVDAASPGYLFLTLKKDEPLKGKHQTLKNRITSFVRTVISDPHVQPNHGWRHTFKTLAGRAKIERIYIDQIQGHAPETTADEYHAADLQTLSDKMKMYPRYLVLANEHPRHD